MFEFFKQLRNSRTSYHTHDSKQMLHMEQDKRDYCTSVVKIITAHIDSCEHFGYPERGIY